MRSLVCLGALTLLTAGCDGKQDTYGGGGPSRTPMAVTVHPNGNNLLRIGQEQMYTASVRWSDGTEATEPASWRSDAPAVVGIDTTGRARAVETGDATIEGAVTAVIGAAPASARTCSRWHRAGGWACCSVRIGIA
jgi:hypothetical protein